MGYGNAHDSLTAVATPELFLKIYYDHRTEHFLYISLIDQTMLAIDRPHLSPPLRHFYCAETFSNATNSQGVCLMCGSVYAECTE